MFNQPQSIAMMKKFALTGMLFVACLGEKGFSQQVTANKISYSYNTLPLLAPVDGYKNYQLVLDASFKKRQVQQINAELERARSYVEDMNTNATAYYQQKRDEQKNVGNMKASVQYVYAQGSDAANVMMYSRVFKPRLINAEEPIPEKFYDMELLASYINLNGYKNKKANALKVIIEIDTFKTTNYAVVSQPTDEVEIGDNGRSYIYQTIHYCQQVTYTLRMRVKVLTPDGREVLNFNPAKLSEENQFSGAWRWNYYSAASDYEAPKLAEQKALRNNLGYINDLLSKGLHDSKRIATLYQINGTAELNVAYNDAVAGLSMLQKENSPAMAKLDKAAGIWSAALLNADGKQALSQQASIALCFNLLEVNFAQGNFDKTEALVNKLNTYPLSVDEKKALKELDKLCTNTRVLRLAVK